MGWSSEQSDSDEPARAFVAIKAGERTWVADLARGESTLGASPDANILIAAPDVDPVHIAITWDGKRLAIRAAGEAPTFLNGKKMGAGGELKPGDEISLGFAQLVVGVSLPVTGGVRRALTHHEFRERLYEEMARAARVGRPTALVMLQAKPGDGGSVASTALDSFRAGDVVGTYAHDELELLLPDTPREVARTVVLRVLSQAGVIGVVGGLAVAPEDGDNPERVLRAARSAVRTAREAGTGLVDPPPRGPTNARAEVTDGASRAVVEEIGALAGNDDSILLTGELSSGKALFARHMHDESARASGPFVVVTCASVAPGGFGNDGEVSPVARAVSGTLVLDEVSDLTLAAQKQLVTMLEGADDVRVVGTTHRALGGLVERGAFDRRLYELLSPHTIEVPALRNRPEDIIPLAGLFASEAGATPPIAMSPGALARLRSYPWPGNILELKNAMERAVRMANDGEVLAEHLPSEVLSISPGEGRLREHVDSVERDAIIKALADSNHNQTHAARRLGLSRRALIYKMEKYGLKPPPGAARKSVPPGRASRPPADD